MTIERPKGRKSPAVENDVPLEKKMEKKKKHDGVLSPAKGFGWDSSSIDSWMLVLCETLMMMKQHPFVGLVTKPM